MAKHTLQRRLNIIYTVIIILLASLSGFTALSLKTFSDSVQSITENQTPTIKGINQALLSVNAASNAIGFSLQKTRFEDLPGIQKAESEFNQAIIQYNIFSHALLLGSESEEFKTIHSGIFNQQWEYLGFRQTLKVPQVNDEQRVSLEEANNIFAEFVMKSQRAFVLKKRFLRLEIDDVNNEQSEVEQEITTLSDEIQNLVIQVSSQMQSLAQRSERLLQNDAEILRFQLGSLRQSLVVLGVIALIIIVTNILYLRRFILSPIQQLSQAVQKITNGDLSQRVDINSNDEIGTLATSFNTMTSNLEQSHANLEERVKEQTEELAEKLDELEKMNKLMVGRELRMVELKQEIKRLNGNSEGPIQKKEAPSSEETS